MKNTIYPHPGQSRQLHDSILKRYHLVLFSLTQIAVLLLGLGLLRNTAQAAGETVTVRVEGLFDNESKEVILNKLNQIRKEAYDEGLTFKFDGIPYNLKPEDYIPLEWSNVLEQATLLRAVESSIMVGVCHERPTGENCFTVLDELNINPRMKSENLAENLAWKVSTDGVLDGIEQFYSEKKYLETQYYTDDQIGHYIAIIRPEFRYTAISAFHPNNSASGISEKKSGWYGVAQMFIGKDDLPADDTQDKIDVSAIPYMHIQVPLDKDIIQQSSISVPDEMYVNDYVELSFYIKTRYQSTDHYETLADLEVIDPKPNYTSAPSNIGTISRTGVGSESFFSTTYSFKPYNPGNVTLTGHLSDDIPDATAVIHVKKPVNSIKIKIPDWVKKDSDGRLLMLQGENCPLKIEIEPKDATVQGIAWESSNKLVASVEKEASNPLTDYVFARSGSTEPVTITAKSVDNPSLSDSIQVIVSCPISAVSINKDSSGKLLLNPGDSQQLSANIYPENATDRNIEYISSDTTVATVSSDGLLKAVSPGQAQVTLRSVANHNISDSIDVIVGGDTTKPVLTIIRNGDITPETGVEFSFTSVPNARNYNIHLRKIGGDLYYNSSVETAGRYRLTKEIFRFEAGVYLMTITANLRDDTRRTSEEERILIINPVTADGPVLRLVTEGPLYGDTGFEIAWTPVKNAVNYSIRMYDVNTGELKYGARAEATRTSFTIKDQKAGTYRVYVWADLAEDGTTITKNSNILNVILYYRTSQNESTIYRNISGAGSEWTQDSTKELQFTFKRSEDDHTTFQHFFGVEVDGKIIQKDRDYTAEAGSVIIRLKPSFLDSLSTGHHTLNVLFDDSDSVLVSFYTRNSVSSVPNSVNNSSQPAPVAVSEPFNATYTQTMATTPYTAGSTGVSTSANSGSGSAQVGSRGNMMTHDTQHTVFPGLIAVFSILLFAFQAHNLTLQRLYRTLSDNLTVYYTRKHTQRTRRK